MSETQAEGPKVVLAAVFITSLITAQLIAVKLLAVPFPGSLPVVGNTVLVPAGVLAYALTFVASDCYTELYGRRSATIMVNIGFVMNFVMLGLVWLAIFAPGSQAGVDPETFASVLGLSTNIVLASLGAYIISQNWDVYIFDRIGTKTGGEHLWMRNLGSTATSQLIDTIIFVLMAFLLVPIVLGVGDALPRIALFELIVGQYILKLMIAVADTPIVYGIVGYVRSNEWVARPTPAAE